MPSRSLAVLLLSAGLLLSSLKLIAQHSVPPPDKEAIRAACQTTTYTMEPGQVDQAVIIKDPAGEQTVLFDVAEGGAIVSLKYQGVEHIWGYNGGGLLQMAFHHSAKSGPVAGDFNPTQAGDGSANSPVVGVACHGTESIDLLTMMLDFNHNNSFYHKPLIAVWAGQINNDIPLSYFSPYTLETRVHWVPNPAGAPKYYLRLDERFTHIADEKVGSFGYDFADYEPWEFDVRAISPENCPCDASATRYMAGGWYKGDPRAIGLGVAMPSSNFAHGKVSGGFNTDYAWRNRNFHLGSEEPLDGIASKALVWYVMVGPWQGALEFARHLPGEGTEP